MDSYLNQQCSHDKKEEKQYQNKSENVGLYRSPIRFGIGAMLSVLNQNNAFGV